MPPGSGGKGAWVSPRDDEDPATGYKDDEDDDDTKPQGGHRPGKGKRGATGRADHGDEAVKNPREPTGLERIGAGGNQGTAGNKDDDE
eukprot:2161145-Karenia_brevis.AAC.1